MNARRPPTRQPVTLIAAMMNVAIRGIYVDVVADGLELRKWSGPQLTVIQQPLADNADLSPCMYEAFRFEAMALGQDIQSTKPGDMPKIWFSTDEQKTGVCGAKSRIRFTSISSSRRRAWLYQNAVAHAEFGAATLETFDLTNHIVMPRQLEHQMRELDRRLHHPRPYDYLMVISTPNFSSPSKEPLTIKPLSNEAVDRLRAGTVSADRWALPGDTGRARAAVRGETSA